MEKLLTGREYARSIHPEDAREAENLERRLQRYASKLPAKERVMIGKAYALPRRRWEALAGQERKAGRPKKDVPDT